MSDQKENTQIKNIHANDLKNCAIKHQSKLRGAENFKIAAN